MALMAVNAIPNGGLRIDSLYSAANTTDTCPTGLGVMLMVKNGSGSSITVTIAYGPKVDGDQTGPARTFTVVATTGESAIPLRDVYKDPVAGVATITYSAVTTVTSCAIRAATS